MLTSAAETSNAERLSRYSLAIFLLADVGLVLLYLGSLAADALWGVEMMRSANLNGRYSLSSVYNYAKYMLAAAALLPVAIFHRRIGYAWIAALVFVLLIDDVLEVHDKIGVAIGNTLSTGWLADMAPQDRGEPIAYLGLLVVALALLGAAFRDMTGSFRRIWIDYTVAITVLAAFGVGVDMLHGVVVAFGSGAAVDLLDIAFVVVEDGGEALTLTVIMWLAVDGLVHAPRACGTAYRTPILPELRRRISLGQRAVTPRPR